MTVIFLGLEIIATYAKIIMGFFQVVAIIILTLQVKQKYVESIESISWWLYLGVSIFSTCLILGFLAFLIKIALCLNGEADNSSCFGATHTGTILNGVCFAVLSLSLLGVIIPLFSSLHSL